MISRRNILFALVAALAIAGCSTTKSLSDGQYILRSNKIKVDDKEFNPSELSSYVLQKPNSWMFGTSPAVAIYNWGGLGKRIGEPPVVYDHSKVDESIENIANHLRYLGYYGSQIESGIAVKKRKVTVTYYVALGRRYKISSIDYEVPKYGTFQEDFQQDKGNISLKEGMFLSEQAIEKEAERSSAYFRTKGYYGFNKSFYFFEADTLASNGGVTLKMFIRDYALGDRPESAQEHRKFTLGDVTITKPSKLKIRKGLLERLNILKPGDLYNEDKINTTYTRLSNVSMLTGLNINTTEAPGEKVDCNIGLRNSGLQGFKINLEASVNTSALVGISPQLSYYHRNIFHGGEVLNIGVKGNFQFKPKSTAYSTEVSTTATIRFPRFIGLPTSLFKGKYIPHTEVSAAFNYQDRPEFKRTAIAGEISYTGRFNERFSYKFTAFRINATRIFGMTKEFHDRLMSNLILAGAYLDNFDMGTSAMLYYTTDNSVVPVRPYHYLRFNFDLSGNFLSIFNSVMPLNENGLRTIWNVPYAQYVRGELHLGKTFRFGEDHEHALALHLCAGAGFSYGNSYGYAMPLEKLFYVGGAYSMRGWQARTLGPGTDTSYSEYFSIPSQVGEMKLEANIEYRFPIFWKLEGAVFADAGNIWDLSVTSVDKAAFGFNTETLEGIGLDWGLGLRLNFGLILVRVDTGVRVHDPGKEYGQRWLGPDKWFKGNYAVHFGVGYPF